MSGYQLSGNAPQAYMKFAPFTMAPWTADLIARAQCKPGDRVLDVACGTGIVTTQIDPACTVIGIDVNDGMLTVARENKDIEWHLGSVSALPFEDSSFDAVLCQQGLQYFPDRTKAMQEMARVLKPNGRLSSNVWGELPRQPFHSALSAATTKYLNEPTVFQMAFSLHTVQELHDLAKAAGLRDLNVIIEHRTMRHPHMRDMIDGFMRSTPVGSKYVALSPDDRTAFIDQVSQQLAGYEDDGGMAVPMENHFLTAVR